MGRRRKQYIYTDNANGVVADKTNAWYIIDLGAKYKIEYVKITDSKNTWTSDRNIKILASNDKNFETGVYEIVSCGASDNHLLGNNITCNSDEYYRYVKLQKVEGETATYGYRYSEFEVYAYPENVVAPQNVALNKTVTAGAWDDEHLKSHINDGNSTTFVWPSNSTDDDPRTIYTDNTDGVASNDGNAWWTIDLGKKYIIEYVKIFDSTETWTSAYNLKVLASNDPTFATGVCTIVNSGTDGSVELGSALGETTDNYYRYVKLQKFPGSSDECTWGCQYSEFEVYAYTDNVKEDKEIEIGTVTGNKSISGKFILNVPYTSYVVADGTKLQVVTAVYNSEGDLIDVILTEKEIKSNETNGSIGGPIEVPTTAASYKVFVWKNMVPLTVVSVF